MSIRLVALSVIVILGGVIAYSSRSSANRAQPIRPIPTTLAAAEAAIPRADIGARGAAYERVAAVALDKQALKQEFEKEIDDDLKELINYCKLNEFSVDELTKFVLKYGSATTRNEWSATEKDLRDSKKNIYMFAVDSNLETADHARDFRAQLPNLIRSRMKNAWLYEDKDRKEGDIKNAVIGKITITIQLNSLQYELRDAQSRSSETSKLDTVPESVTVKIAVSSVKGSSSWEGERTYEAKTAAPERIKKDRSDFDMNLFRVQQKAIQLLMADLTRQINSAPEFIVNRAPEPADGK